VQISAVIGRHDLNRELGDFEPVIDRPNCTREVKAAHRPAQPPWVDNFPLGFVAEAGILHRDHRSKRPSQRERFQIGLFKVLDVACYLHSFGTACAR
jgi:hypothetical protein